MMDNSPIIISGMHRSGTSMVTRILHKLGLTVGEKLDSNHESIFFQRINIWMMSLLGSSWDSPKSFNSIDLEIKKNIMIQLEGLLNSRTNSMYFGWSSIIKKGSFSQIAKPWGWKDPRNTFTSSIWKEVFPDLKTIYIVRHPIDTAESLFQRQIIEKSKDIQRDKKYLDLVKSLISITHTGYNSSMLLNSYKHCFNLIELYYDQISNNSDENSLIIKFEDIISNPEIEIQNMLTYCGLTCTEKDLEDVIRDINPSKKFSYRNDSNLLEFEKTFEGLIEKMGYLD